MRALGYKRGPADPRDRDVAMRVGAGAFPRSATTSEYVVDVLNQGNIGSCVANACLQAVRMDMVRQGVKSPPLGSRLMAYYLARAYDHEESQDAGTYTRRLFQAIRKFGFCPETVWPYDTGQWATMPPSEAFRESFDQKDLAYHRFLNAATRIDDMCRAIAMGHPVCFGTDVTDDFCNGVGVDLTIVHRPTPDKAIAGGHELLAVDYDTTADGSRVFRVLNSWGDGWSGDGYCFMHEDYFTWLLTDDLEIVDAAPIFSDEDGIVPASEMDTPRLERVT